MNTSMMENLISPKANHSNSGKSSCWEVPSFKETPSASRYFLKGLTSRTYKNQRRLRLLSLEEVDRERSCRPPLVG